MELSNRIKRVDIPLEGVVGLAFSQRNPHVMLFRDVDDVFLYDFSDERQPGGEFIASASLNDSSTPLVNKDWYEIRCHGLADYKDEVFYFAGSYGGGLAHYAKGHQIKLERDIVATDDFRFYLRDLETNERLCIAQSPTDAVFGFSWSSNYVAIVFFREVALWRFQL